MRLCRPSRRSLGHAIDERFRGLAQLKNPTWWKVVGLGTGADTPTEVDSMGQLNIGMALLTEAGIYFWVL
jgi:hypothetical protein